MALKSSERTVAINGAIWWVVAEFTRQAMRMCRTPAVVVYEQEGEILTVRIQEVSGGYAYYKQFDNPEPKPADVSAILKG